MRFLKSVVFKRAFNYLNNLAKKQKRRFLLFHSIWQRFALWEEGEFAPLYIKCAPIKGRKEGENAVSRFAARGGVALKITTFCFVSSKQNV